MLDVSIFRTIKNFVRNEGVSVIDEIEKIIVNNLKNENIDYIYWTCIDENDNPVKKMYGERFSKYRSKILKDYSKLWKKDIIIFVLEKIVYQ